MDATFENESMQEKLFQMQSKRLLTDVIFLVGKNKKPVHAHRIILCSRSTVFYQMFTGSLAEKSTEIKLPDIKENIFNSVLKYMYTNDVTIDKVSVEELLYAAEKYELQHLKTECSKYLCTDLKDVYSAFFALELADKYNVDQLKQESLQIIAQKPGDLFESQQFLEAKAEVIKILLDCNELKMQEVDIYNALIKWAQEECKRQDVSFCDSNIRRMTKDMLPLIRFPTMTPVDFKKLCENNVLLPEEKMDVLQCFSMKDYKSEYFCSDERIDFKQVKRFDTVQNGQWNSAGCFDAIQFTVQKSALLKGICLFKSAIGMSDFIVSLHDGSRLISSADGSCDESLYKENFFEVLFPALVMIKPGQTYTIETRTKNYANHYGDNGKSVISFGNCNQITFMKCPYSKSTTVSSGQIPVLLLSD